MKAKYETPKAEIIAFRDSDIIITSDTTMPRVGASGGADTGSTGQFY